MILPLLAAGVVVLLAGSLGIALYATSAACGRIESLGELDASFRVRMSDGSSRVFQSP